MTDSVTNRRKSLSCYSQLKTENTKIQNLEIQNDYKTLGGVHLTSNTFTPTSLLKDLTGTEYSGRVDLAVLRDMTAVQHFNELQVTYF